MTASLEVDQVEVAFDETPVLRGASLAVDRGEIVALLGPSGSGKSTLLRVVAGIVAPDRGRVVIDGDDVTEVPTHRRAIGMVFQDNQLFPHRSTLDNVAFGLKMTGVNRATRQRQATEWLERVELSGFGSRDVTELSGGEAKRVALARTLITEPRLLLLDEPLTGLDSQLRDQLTEQVAALLRSTGTTAILVTHDVDEANAIADRCVDLADLQQAR